MNRLRIRLRQDSERAYAKVEGPPLLLRLLMVVGLGISSGWALKFKYRDRETEREREVHDTVK